ncbi:hypothetical protein Hypma_010809 [Hypsizygus marmoreus]|uniref:Uncharacterized protein n=1 Tax=Hypsizygus marmoreus TaxID=39966 RepID=A0A369JMR0_HYPMA|nr:hypothetical protein Hypma_010809 [Hypsizygus marmoreus]
MASKAKEASQIAFWTSEESFISAEENYDAEAKETEASFPYAYMGGDCSYDPLPTSWETPFWIAAEERIIYPQDSAGQHVTVKAVENDSDEYRILRLFTNEAYPILKTTLYVLYLSLILCSVEVSGLRTCHGGVIAPKAHFR